MASFTVQVTVRDANGLAASPRYYNAAGAHGSEAIAATRLQMARENEPPAGCRASFHAKRCPPGRAMADF